MGSLGIASRLPLVVREVIHNQNKPESIIHEKGKILK